MASTPDPDLRGRLSWQQAATTWVRYAAIVALIWLLMLALRAWRQA